MAIKGLDHYSIRTDDLAATTRFYTEVLDLEVGPRPDFPFPGVWLYRNGSAVVHVIGTADAAGLVDYLGDRRTPDGGGALDHVAFVCDGIEAMRARFEANGAAMRERLVPGMNLRQIFLQDPNGVTIELNYPG